MSTSAKVLQNDEVSDIVLVTGGSVVGSLLLLWGGWKFLLWYLDRLKRQENRKRVFEQILTQAKRQHELYVQSLRDSYENDTAHNDTKKISARYNYDNDLPRERKKKVDKSLVEPAAPTMVTAGAYAFGPLRIKSEHSKHNLTVMERIEQSDSDNDDESSIVVSSLHTSERSSYDGVSRHIVSETNTQSLEKKATTLLEQIKKKESIVSKIDDSSHLSRERSNESNFSISSESESEQSILSESV